MCFVMSSSQRFTGLPRRLVALCRESAVGSQRRALTLHLSSCSVATFCAQRHLRLLCSVIQSWMPSAFIWFSASCVLLLIHSTQVSVASPSSVVVVSWLFCSGGLLSTSPGSESESVVALSLCVDGCVVGGPWVEVGGPWVEIGGPWVKFWYLL